MAEMACSSFRILCVVSQPKASMLAANPCRAVTLCCCHGNMLLICGMAVKRRRVWGRAMSRQRLGHPCHGLKLTTYNWGKVVGGSGRRDILYKAHSKANCINALIIIVKLFPNWGICFPVLPIFNYTIKCLVVLFTTGSNQL